MTLGEFRKLVEALPDETELFCGGQPPSTIFRQGNAVIVDDASTDELFGDEKPDRVEILHADPIPETWGEAFEQMCKSHESQVARH